MEMSSGVEGGPSSGGKSAPPLYANRCARHGDVEQPGPCGDCKDAREAANVRPLALVPGPTRRCIVHDQSYTTVCSGCRADYIAAKEETA